MTRRRRSRPVTTGPGHHLDAGSPPAPEGVLDEIGVTFTATEDAPGAREKIVRLLADLLKTPPGGGR